jgi:hypothetical protein
MKNSKRRRVSAAFIVGGFLCALGLAAGPPQTVETADGVRVVHNEKGGLWGKTPRVSLELVRKIGDVDTDDENLAFTYPSDVAVDAEGAIYILDTGNARIQKFGPDGRYLATIGRKGQGPGEFMMPDSFDFDKDGNLVVNDAGQRRVQTIIGGGRDVESFVVQDEFVYGLRCLSSGDCAVKLSTYSFPRPGQKAKTAAEMRLFRILGPEGTVKKDFGALTDFGESLTNAAGNAGAFDSDAGDALVIAFNGQNKVEKYGPDGTLLWRADRPLNYGTDVRKKGKVERTGRGISMEDPEMNECSVGVAVDGRGRLWVATYDRQLKKEEKVQTSIMSVGGAGGISSVSYKTEGNTDIRTTDAFRLDVFDGEGVLLGSLPLTHFVDVVRICGDRLFLIDRDRGVTVYQYKIVEK